MDKSVFQNQNYNDNPNSITEILTFIRALTLLKIDLQKQLELT